MALYERHGLSHLPEYSVWHGIKDRCLNPNSCNWSRYGGRGIMICERWKDTFVNFYNDMGPRPTDEHSIERNDNDGHYEPNNCRWATTTEQVYNRSTNIMVEIPHLGISTTPQEAARLLGMKKQTLHTRLARGGDLSTPVAPKERLYNYNGEMFTLQDLMVFSAVSAKTLYDRLGYGWDVERALCTPAQEIPTYEINGKQMTVPEIATLFDIKNYNITHHLRQGKTMTETIAFLTRKRG